MQIRNPRSTGRPTTRDEYDDLPATSYSDSIIRPPCPKCGDRMLLARIEPDKPDHDKRTFECPKCQHEESIVVKYR
jgi:ssDNA-binding Zn-finger/Zn-ribbon topoisomerase 1